MSVNNMDSMMSVNTINSLLKQAWGVESISTTNTQLFVSDATKTLVAGSYKGLILKLIATINPKQAGSGEPSPDNVRPISGWDEIKTFVSPTTSAEDGTTYTADLSETVYGGSLDVVNGVLTVDRAMVDLGSLNWSTAVSVGITRFRAPVAGIKRVSLGTELGQILCSNYATKTANQTYSGQVGISIQQNTDDVYIYDPQKEELSGAAFKDAMSGVQLCYELAESRTIQLTPKQVTTLLGTNNVWADSGVVSVEYWGDTGTIKTDSGEIVTFNII